MNRRDERDDMVGLDKEVETLMELILRKDHPATMFIPLIGESGVGKSTLAKAVYDRTPNSNEAVAQIKYMLSLEPDLWPEEIVGKMYNAMSEVAEELPESGEDTDLAANLRGFLSDRKFVVIIGGISSIAMLNLFRKCFPSENKKGSSVVLVLDAEKEDVALHANAMNEDRINRIHLLSRLDERRSGKLFRYKALRKEEVLSHGREEGQQADKYDEIVYGITGGHRLSIVLLAGLVRFKEKPLQWDVVLQQLIMPAGSRIMVGEEEEEDVADQQQKSTYYMSTTTALERIFWESFEDLPNDIKSCFLYFVTFVKNVRVFAEIIVRGWIGEGFIKPQRGVTMEELGHRYIKELALRCLIHVESRDYSGRIRQVRVHSSLHGFLQSEAREAGFAEIHDIHDLFVPPSARRLSFQIYGGRYSTITKKLPKLRSFISTNTDEKIDKATRDSTGAEKQFYDLSFLLGSKFLRVMVLEVQRIKELPGGIGNLLLELRYLSINSRELKELPSSIKRLLNLQTLNIGGTAVQRIDPGFWKIKTLRHVFASDLSLPESLEHEEELGELQTLSGVKPPQGHAWKVDNCPLRKMRKLRTLDLCAIQHEYHRDALEAALEGMHLLVSVTLRGDLLPPCVYTAKNLRFLEVIQLLGRVDWPTGPLNAQMIRPNLRHVWMEPLELVPTHILEELQW